MLEQLSLFSRFTSATLENVPETPGVYLLFAENGLLIYVGKTNDLKSRLEYHFSDRETNSLIRLLAKKFLFQTTNTESEAETIEGLIYDNIIEFTGTSPIANIIAPPRSQFDSRDKIIEYLKHHPSPISLLLLALL